MTAAQPASGEQDVVRRVPTRFLAIAVLLTMAACAGSARSPERSAEPLSFDGVPFRTDWTAAKTVVLVNGRYRERAAPGSVSLVEISLSDTRARGAVDGRETAAAVLITSGGGSGTFADLVLLVRGRSGWEHRDTAPLGDRVQVRGLAFAGRTVVVDLLEQGPDDPLCCPTQHRTRRYQVVQGRLKAE